MRSAGIGLFFFQPPVANCAKSSQALQVGSVLERSKPRAADAFATGRVRRDGTAETVQTVGRSAADGGDGEGEGRDEAEAPQGWAEGTHRKSLRQNTAG
ncbi:MAG TPA: hypothetical protein VGT98_02210 [Candidatus Elarobacter sp.]|nr:hypothetical protein [Candidatus Elarobacter sp.]HEV2737416.1 hypothetical protein [Candidatus Elarobacter sp.]